MAGTYGAACLADRPAAAGQRLRHFLRDDDLSPAEQSAVLKLAAVMKSHRFECQALAGPLSVAVLLDKPALRTRVSFSVGIAELGGNPLIIDMASTHAGRGESIGDTARRWRAARTARY